MTFTPWRTLRGRLLLLALFVEALMLLLLITNNLQLLRDKMSEQARLQAEQIGPVISAALVAPLAQADYATVQAVLDDSHVSSGIEYLAVIDKQGHLVAISGWPAESPLPETRRGFVIDENDSAPRYDVARPVMLAGQQLGTLHFGLDLKQIIAARRSLLKQSVLIAFGELLLSTLLLASLGLLVTRQLSALTQASNEVAAGNLTSRLAPEGSDDVGRLGVAFNKMSQAVNERIFELVTARDEMARLARESEQDRARIAALVAAMEFGLLFADLEHRFVYANQALGRLWDMDTGVIDRGTDLNTLLALFLPKIRSSDVEAAEMFRETATRAEIVLHNGRIMKLQRLPVASVNNEVLGWLWLFSDVTHDRRAAAQLVAAKDAANLASQAKSAFLANMSHEIRTPMNGVIGMLDLALDASSPTEQLEFIQIARGSAESLLTVINDVLDFSKIEAGKIEIESIVFDPVVLLLETLKSLRFAADAKGLLVRETMAADIPRYIKGDPDRLRQVVVNLLSNAIKFTVHGEVALRASVELSAPGTRQLQIAVSDTGIGIASVKQQQIFDAFTQEDVSTTRRFGGTGLGLSISRRLVELMGGEISVESEVGQGSTFRVVLPLMECAEPVAQFVAPPAALPSVSLAILVAEDHPVNQRLMLTVLERLGHRVALANNGREAVDLWGSSTFDLILMDMQMPIMGGIEATIMIRQMEAARGVEQHTRIYALSAAALDSEQQQGLDAGLDGYLTKPLDRSALLDVLAAAVQSRNSNV